MPWLWGHWIAFELSQSTAESMTPWMWAATVLAYVLPAVYVVSLFLGAGRTPYDRVSDTVAGSS